MKINILFPVLNEEKRLKSGIEKTLDYINQNKKADFILTIVDNGSTDETEEISRKLCEKDTRISYIKTSQKGVGLAIREGAAANTCEVVGYMDIDLSTDLKHLGEMVHIFLTHPDVLMINGSRLHKNSIIKGRKLFRRITSKGLTLFLKISLGMKASDSICGFKFYRKNFLEEMIQQSDTRENSWFFIIEMLIRGEKSGAQIHELPVHWEDDPNTTVKTGKLIRHYIKQTRRLRRQLNKEKSEGIINE